MPLLLLVIVALILGGCSQERSHEHNTTTTATAPITKHYAQAQIIDPITLDPMHQDITCEGEMGRMGVEQYLYSQGNEHELLDIKTHRMDENRSECEVRHLTLSRTEGIIGQEILYYALTHDLSGYTIAIAQERAKPHPSLLQDDTCAGGNAHALLRSFVAPSIFEHDGIRPRFEITSITSEKHDTRGSICRAVITTYNTDPSAIEPILNVQTLRYRILHHEDNGTLHLEPL